MARTRDINYDGFAFRSKIEAQWYIYYKALNIDVVYEPATYELKLGKRRTGYCPDFEILELSAFVEIKYEKEPPLEACLKCRQLAISTGKDTYLFWRPPWEKKWGGYLYAGGTGTFYPDVKWTVCPTCSVAAITTGGIIGHLLCSCEQTHPTLSNCESSAVGNAAAAAKRERFF